MFEHFNRFLEWANKFTMWDLRRVSYFLNIKQKLGANWFFDVISLTPEYQEIDFGFSACNIAIINDENAMMFSWDGNKLAGLIYAKEELELSNLERDKVFVKGNGTCRIWCF